MNQNPVKRGRGRPSNESKRLAEVERQLAQYQMRYDAAGSGRRLRGWIAPQSGPQTAVRGLETLRARARDSGRNDWASESSAQKWTTNLVGVGITAREKPTVPDSRRESRTALWNRFCTYLDADGILDFYGQQTLGVRTWLESGEYFLRRRPRRSDSKLEVPLQVQMIEGDFCPIFDANVDQFRGVGVGNYIRSGIEIDRTGQKVAYWLFKEHPGDVGGSYGVGAYLAPSPEQMVRVAASDIRHVFEPKRIGQLRGVPGMASVLTRLRNVADFDDAVLERQKLANLIMGFITRTTSPGDDTSIDPSTGKTYESDALGNAMVSMEPGTIQELNPGEKMEWSNPPEAGTMYSEYMRTSHLGTAAGAGLPYELFSGDILNVSDRTLRIVIQEFRRFAEQRQWQVVIPMHCQTVRNWFVDAAALAGLVPVTLVDEAKDVKWSPHGWQYIHPVQDATGKALEVLNGVRSRSSWIDERGDDPEAVDKEREADAAREKGLDLQSPSNLPPAPKPAAAPTAPTALENAQITMLAAMAQPREPAAPQHITVQAPQVHNHLPEPKVEVTNHLPPMQVENHLPPMQVENKIDVSPTPVEIKNEIDVSPTPVTIENNIEAKAGEMTIDVNLPERKTTSEIARNSKGEIVEVVQTEKTIQ